MPKSKNLLTLSALIDSDTDDDQITDRMSTIHSHAEQTLPAKKGRGRPKAQPSKITKTKAPARRTSGRLNTKTKGKAGTTAKDMTRRALTDKTNEQSVGDVEEVDEFDQDEDTIMEEASVGELSETTHQFFSGPGSKKITGIHGKAMLAKPSVKSKTSSRAQSADLPQSDLQRPKAKGRARKQKAQDSTNEKTITETQLPSLEVDEDVIEEEVAETVSRSAFSVSDLRSQPRTFQPTVQRRAGSASDNERNDPALRRKLGDLTKKYENLHMKYQDIREIGLKEAERNFERLKKQQEEKTKASNLLIESLKADLVTQNQLAKDSKGLKEKIELQSTEIAALHTQIVQINSLLSETQAENKTLLIKLAANRNVAASVESSNNKPPGSVVKANGGIRMIGTVEAAQAAQAAQLKEDIYGDLTGLIIRGVKREAAEDVFDCIQTGRNGTLHFKLGAANEKTTESYDDAQCNYRPQFDPNRDQALMELLPGYLVDEITFPRQHADKFYARVIKALTEKLA